LLQVDKNKLVLSFRLF